MSIPVLLVAFAVGAGLLALWIDVRFPALAPELRVAVMHVGVTIVLGQLLVPLLGKANFTKGPAGVMMLLFLIALPALIYCFLTSVWLLKNLQAVMRR
jgi:hypothetical protein